ncbi:hypothetical protein Bca4012_083722 [Brassica carinata]
MSRNEEETRAPLKRIISLTTILMSQSSASKPTAKSSPEKTQQRATVVKKIKFDGRTDQRFDKERIDSLNRSRESDSHAHET